MGVIGIIIDIKQLHKIIRKALFTINSCLGCMHGDSFLVYLYLGGLYHCPSIRCIFGKVVTAQILNFLPYFKYSYF